MRKVLFFIVVTLLTQSLWAQEDRQHFIKITHAGGLTVAVDSSGDTWYYDSEAAEFVREDDFDGLPDGYEDEGGGFDESLILPPEVRCTEIIDGDIVDLLDEVVVEIDERVEGKITSGKNVTIKGLVIGNVISFRTVYIERTGEVRGDVTAPNVVKESGARVLGRIQEVPVPDIGNIGVTEISGVFPDFAALLLTAIWIFLCVITIAVAPTQVSRVVNKVKEKMVSSFFWGLLGWVMIVPVFLLLVITIVGIPIAILVFPFVLVAAWVMGYVAASIYIGGILNPLFGWRDKSTYVKGIVGIAAIGLGHVLANILVGLGAQGLGVFLSTIFLIVSIVALTVGFGAVISSKFGAQPKVAVQTADSSASPEGPAPPREPAPPTPPVKPPPPPPRIPPPPKRSDATD
jgi:hypothetical protein